MQEYKFKITIDGVDGKLYYSVEAESEQEARETVNFFLQSQPFVIELDLWDNYQKGKIMKKLKEEYQPGGSKRHVILDKAVQYLKDPRFGLQGDKQRFLMDQLGLSQSEYLTCLNDAAGGDYWQ